MTSKLDLDFFENVILFNLLTSSEFVSSISSHLDVAFFNNKHIGRVAGKVLEFFNDRGSVPSVTELKSRMASDEDKKSLSEVKLLLKDLDTNFNRDELLSNTERFLKERFLYKTILDIAEKFSDQTFQIETALSGFEKAYNISLRDNLGHWYFDDIEKHINDLQTVYHPIPTGWKFYDEKTEGGLFPKTLNVFAGQVNVGKSIVLGNIAANLVQQGKNVLLVSLEMSEFMYAKRISTQLSQIPHGDLKTYTSELVESLKHIKKQISSNLVIKEFPPKTLTVRQLDGFIEKLKHKGFVPDVVVIDYINLLQPLGKNMNSYESVKEVSEHLRALAFKYNIPVVSATQLNRGAFNTASPGMEGIAESIGLAATADTICSLWRDEESTELGIINMSFQKNRFGPNFGTGAFKCNFNTLTLKETSLDYFDDESSTESDVRKLDSALNQINRE